MFADDSDILADTEATDTLHDIACFAKPFGQKIYIDKTKVMRIDSSQVSVHLKGIQIEQVPNFKYLGSLVHDKMIT